MIDFTVNEDDEEEHNDGGEDTNNEDKNHIEYTFKANTENQKHGAQNCPSYLLFIHHWNFEISQKQTRFVLQFSLWPHFLNFLKIFLK